MARKGMAGIIALGIVFSLMGCGTLRNIDSLTGVTVLDGDPTPDGRVFGGVRRDVEWARGCIHAPERRGNLFSAIDAETPLETRLAWASFFLFLDLPFSAVGDTLTLPFTIPRSLLREHRDVLLIRQVIDEAVDDKGEPLTSVPALREQLQKLHQEDISGGF